MDFYFHELCLFPKNTNTAASNATIANTFRKILLESYLSIFGLTNSFSAFCTLVKRDFA